MKIFGKDVYIPSSKRREWFMIIISLIALFIAGFSLIEAQNTSELTKIQIDLIYKELQPNVVLKEKVQCPTFANYGKFDTIKLVNLGNLPTHYTINLQGEYLFFRPTPTSSDFEKIERHFKSFMDEYYSGKLEGRYLQTYSSYKQEGLIEGKETINPIFFLHVGANVLHEDTPTLRISLNYLDLKGDKITIEILNCSYEAFVDKDELGRIEDIGYFDRD